MNKKQLSIKWLSEPAKHDYTAAKSYLTLVFAGDAAGKHVKKLRNADMSAFKSRDLLRASGLSRLGISNSHVEHDREKIMKGSPLSPLLLVRDSRNGRLIIADGYHRLCAVYMLDEDAPIPCKIV
jgi:hypothetical protein